MGLCGSGCLRRLQTTTCLPVLKHSRPALLPRVKGRSPEAGNCRGWLRLELEHGDHIVQVSESRLSKTLPLTRLNSCLIHWFS